MANANKHLTDELYSFTTCDILIVDLETGIELYSGKLKSHSINKSSNKTAIKAGIGGITWVELEDSNEITIEISDLAERIDMEALKLSGSIEVPVEDIELTAFPKNYEVTNFTPNDVCSIDLQHEPLDTEVVTVYRTDTGVPIHPERIERIGDLVQVILDPAHVDGAGQPVPTDTIDGIKDKDTLLVGSYKYIQKDAHVIKIAADQVGTNVSVTLKQPLYGADRKVKMWRQYHFYRCSLGSEFSQESATEMAEQNTSSSFTVLKDPKRDELGFVAYVPVTPAYGTGNAPFRANKTKRKK